jgi:hypothetical protein
MKGLIELYRRMDVVQRTRRFRVGATVVVVLLCGVVFGALLTTSYRMHGQRQALIEALSGQNLNEGDELALSLSRTGTVVVNGITYGGDRYQRNADLFFDEQGTIRAPAALANRLLDDQRPAWAPRWMLEQPQTTWLLAALTTAWLLLIVWLDIAVPFLLTVVGTAIPVAVCWLAGSTQGMLAFAGIGLLTFSYLVLTRLVLAALNWPRQVLSVAYTVVKEASRTRVSLVFIVVLLVVLPLLPLGLDAESPLRYQLQTFISRSMGLTFLVAACMTLFLSCATVAFEIRDRQIWQLVTKPLSRFNYLLGKWVGVLSVNLILLLVSGISIFTFVQYLRERPVASGLEGQLDAMAVQNEVLTARVSRLPSYDVLDPAQVNARTEQIITRTPELAAMPEVPLETIRQIQSDLQEGYLLGQRTIPPAGGLRTYRFTGLDRVTRDAQSILTLRYRFHILRSDEHETFPATFFINENPNLAVRRTYVPTMSHVLPIPTSMIRDDGTLVVTVRNEYVPGPQQQGYGAINFELKDFELMYSVGSFEFNFLRAVLINWIKLAFLAMLGVSCATFLNFSVSCLLSFTIFAAGLLGPFLADALAQWAPPAVSQMDWSNIALVVQWAFQWFIKAVAELLVWALSGFGELSATQALVEGKAISWMDVGRGMLKLGVLWSGVTLLIGYVVIRSRQLAIYSGHG